MSQESELRKKYEDTLNELVSQLKKDKYILAMYVFGSMSHGKVWEGSDIDLILVVKDERLDKRYINLRMNDIYIYVEVVTREQFRERTQRVIQGSWFHHIMATARLVFSIDDSITSLGELEKIGSRDKYLSLLRQGETLTRCLSKCHKTLRIEKDLIKCYNWVNTTINVLSRVILLMNNLIPGRDVVAEVRQCDPGIIKVTLDKLTSKQTSLELLEDIINNFEVYLDENKQEVFKFLIDYLKDSMHELSSSELDRELFKIYGSTFEGIPICLEWLEEKGLILLGNHPARITSKSKITVDEMTVMFIGN
ncbi:MAG: nucleotidyltransferase domain-containing protein [Candidatus Hodarchaeales archaeon]|jgi:predicted nucleotidyltransferase